MKADKINGITPEQKQKMYYTAAGIGTGIIAGGAAGYFVPKPWIKNNDLTDTFVKQAFKASWVTILDDLEILSKTGNTNKTSKGMKEIIAEAFNNPPTSEELKNYATKKLNGYKEDPGITSKSDIDNIINNATKEEIAEYKPDIKKYFNIKDKKLILPEDADAEIKSGYYILQSLLKKIKLKNAATGAGIGAVIIGTAGFCAALVKNKKSTPDKTDK